MAEFVPLASDEKTDAQLLAMATDRMAHYDANTVISGEDLYKELGITKAALDNVKSIEIE